MKLYSKIIGKGTPLLILHGLFGMGDNWKTLGKRFADEAGYEVHLIDQRNHGRSPHSKTWNYAVMAEDIRNYCAQHKLDKVILIGHSMGGKTGMHLAVKYPEMLAALIVVDIAPKVYPPHHQVILEGLSALANEKLTTRRQANDLLAAFIPQVSVRQFLLKNLYWKEKGQLCFRMNLPVITQNIDEVGQAIADEDTYKGNTLFIKGENSGYIQAADRDLLKRHFPKSQLLTIKDSDHWVHAEKPEEFYKAVTGFLKIALAQ